MHVAIQECCSKEHCLLCQPRYPYPRASASTQLDEEVVEGAKKGGGVLGGFMSGLRLRVMGSEALKREDIQPALTEMKRRLMERNVAEPIAEK